ncbi:VanZ family protein [Thiobacter aerophilum]|uniref:VanZ family protein n=1 Tax=Thiobacter aerophilum TaxID=3121275 RepID=A0ABV0EIJ5_9BURK
MDAPLSWPSLWMRLGGLMVAAVVYLSLMPTPPHPLVFPHGDKLEHAATFAWLAFWFLQITPRRALPMAALLSLGVAIEIAQSFTPTRSAEAADVVADAVGLLLGAKLAGTRAGRLLALLESRLSRLRVSI